MLGLGTWEFPINIMVYKGAVQMDITGDGGAYGFALRVPDYEIPPVEVRSVTEEGDTLHIIARVAMFPKKDIPVSVTFDGDRASGVLKAPFIGKIKLNDGRRIT